MTLIAFISHEDLGKHGPSQHLFLKQHFLPYLFLPPLLYIHANSLDRLLTQVSSVIFAFSVSCECHSFWKASFAILCTFRFLCPHFPLSVITLPRQFFLYLLDFDVPNIYSSQLGLSLLPTTIHSVLQSSSFLKIVLLYRLNKSNGKMHPYLTPLSIFVYLTFLIWLVPQ